MIQFFTAIGCYELRTNENGGQTPVLINNQQRYEPSICEMLLWSSLLWHIHDQQELAETFTAGKAELHICDEYSLHYYCNRLERLGFLRRGSGYTAADALFDLMGPLYPIPASAGPAAKLCSFMHLVFRRGVPIHIAGRIFRPDPLSEDEHRVMGLLKQNNLSTSELIVCMDQGNSSAMDRLYSCPSLTCDNLPAYVRSSRQLIPVLQAVTNLYLRRLLVLEYY